MPATATVVTRVPLPASLRPSTVVSALHTYEPLIVANPYVQSYERQPVVIAELVGDAFFRADGSHLRAFVVHDRVPVLGTWASKGVRIPCVFQAFDAGVRCRARAQAGVTVRSSYEVRRRGEVPRHAGEPPAEKGEDEWSDDGVRGGYELVEVAVIECGSLVKPFVKRSFASAHRAILRRVVDEVMKASQEGAADGRDPAR